MTDYPNVPIGQAIGDLHTGLIPILTDASEAKRYREAVHLLSHPAFPEPTRQVTGGAYSYTYVSHNGLNLNYGYDLGSVAANSTEDYLGVGTLMQATLKEVWLNCILSATGPPESYTDVSECRVVTQQEATTTGHILGSAYLKWQNNLFAAYTTNRTNTIFMETRSLIDYMDIQYEETAQNNTAFRIKNTSRKVSGYGWVYYKYAYNNLGPIYHIYTEITDLMRTTLLHFETRTLVRFPVTTNGYLITPTDTTTYSLLAANDLLGVSSGSSKPIDKTTGSEIIRGFPDANLAIRYPTYVGGLGFKVRTDQRLRGLTNIAYHYDSIDTGGFVKYPMYMLAIPRRLTTSRGGRDDINYTLDEISNTSYYTRSKAHGEGLKIMTNVGKESELGSQFIRSFTLECTKLKNLKFRAATYAHPYPGCSIEACVQWLDTVARTDYWGLETTGLLTVTATGFRVANAFKVVLNIGKIVREYVGDYFGIPTDSYTFYWSNSYDCYQSITASTLALAVEEYIASLGSYPGVQIIESYSDTPTIETVIIDVDINTTQTLTKTLFGSVVVEIVITVDTAGKFTAFTIQPTSGSPSGSEYLYKTNTLST